VEAGGRAEPGPEGTAAVSSLASSLTQLHGWVAYTVIAALVFGETAVFIGFVLPGEIAAVLGGVLASRGHLSLPLLIVIVVLAALAGPLVGYEIGRRMGDRLFASRALSRASQAADRARSALSGRGGTAVFFGRFVAVVRAIMPAAAGAARVRYRTFALANLASGLIWGVGYCLIGYLAGSAYGVVESRVGAGLAALVAAIVIGGVAAWLIRRHRRQAHEAKPPPGSEPAAQERAPGPESDDPQPSGPGQSVQKPVAGEPPEPESHRPE
jgi:membrane-associated protein